ncbi:MAG: PAS domain-containing protein [bacterium]|nr:PAS domain-containing protein [bacterium]
MKGLKGLKKKTRTNGAHDDADLLWRVAWTYIRTVIDTAREPFLILDAKLRVLSGNRMFYRFFRVTKKETEQTLVYKLGDGQWNIPALQKLLEKILPKNTFFADYEVDHVFPGIGRKIILLNARRVYSTQSNLPIVLLAMEDITKRKELEEKLRDYAIQLNSAVSARTKELELRVKQLEQLNRTI